MIHLENVLKISLQDVLRTSSKRLEDVLKMSWRRFSRRLEDVLKTSWRRLEDVYARRLEDVLKTSWRHLEDVWPRQIHWSWLRRLEDVFWRRKAKAYIFALIKTSWRRLEDILWRRKTFSRRLQDVFIKTNVCWESLWKILLGLFLNTLPHINVKQNQNRSLWFFPGPNYTLC